MSIILYALSLILIGYFMYQTFPGIVFAVMAICITIYLVFSIAKSVIEFKKSKLSMPDDREEDILEIPTYQRNFIEKHSKVVKLRGRN